MFRLGSRFFLMGHHPAESGRCLSPTFWRWFAFTWIPDWRDELGADSSDIREGWPTAPLGVSWLAAESPPVTQFEERFIVTAAESPYSMLLVESVTSGWFLNVRDLLTGKRFRIVDPDISEHVLPDEIVFGAVLTLDGVSTLLGAATHTIPLDYRLEILQVRQVCGDAQRRGSGDGWLTRAELLDVAAELCETYCEAYEADRVFEIDTGGDSRDPTLVRWTVSAPFAELLGEPRPLSVSGSGGEFHELEIGSDGEPHALIAWYRTTPHITGDARKIAGFLHLDEGRLAATVPTRVLADRIVQEIDAHVGETARLVERRQIRPEPVHSVRSYDDADRPGLLIDPKDTSK